MGLRRNSPFLLLLVLLIFFLFINRVEADEDLKRVLMIDKGAVVPDAISPEFEITRDLITCRLRMETRSGDISNEWSKQTDPSHFMVLDKLITDQNLFESPSALFTPDTPRSVGKRGCIGHRGFTIHLEKKERYNRIVISGLVICRPMDWPKGLRQLFDTLTQLRSYYCSPEEKIYLRELRPDLFDKYNR